MEALIAWCGFFGAWLLVAGPFFQAAIELSEEQAERVDIGRVADEMQKNGQGLPPPVSPWWWLFPPMLWWKSARRNEAVGNMMITQLTSRQTEIMVDYMNKTTGWVLVGIGGLLIAAKETWELIEHNEWPVWLFWVLMAAGFVACLTNAGFRMRRAQDIIERRRALQEHA